jgi:hypothetical protein
MDHVINLFDKTALRRSAGYAICYPRMNACLRVPSHEDRLMSASQLR